MMHIPAPESEIFEEAEKTDLNNEITDRFLALLKETIANSAFTEDPSSPAPGINWKTAYENLIEQTLEYALKQGLLPTNIAGYFAKEDIKASVNNFMKQLNSIQGQKYLYSDIHDPQKLEKLLATAGQVTLWTTGDIANNYQQLKIQSSQVEQHLREAAQKVSDPPPQVTIHISDHKTESIPLILDTFWQAQNNPQEIAVVIIDDSRSVFKKSHDAIDTWITKRGKKTKVKRVYIRSKRGKKAQDNWKTPIEHPISEAQDLTGFTQLIEENMRDSYIPRKHTIILLDFDGTLSDNEKTEQNQIRLVSKNLLAFFEKGIRQWASNGADGTVETEDDDRFIILESRFNMSPAERISAYTHRMLYRLLPLWKHNTTFTSPLSIIKRLKEAISFDPDENSLAELNKLDKSYRNSGGLLPWQAYREIMTAWESEGQPGTLMYQIGPWPPKFEGQIEWYDPAYFNSHARTKPRQSGLDPLLYNLIISDKKKPEALSLAEPVEKRIQKICHKGSPPFNFISGGLKSKASTSDKIELVGINKINNIGDMVRGMVVVDGLKELSLCSAMLAQEFENEIVRFNNYYQSSYLDEKTDHPRAYKSCRMIIKLSPEITYELQIRTKRSKAAGDLDHETIKKQSISLKDEEINYIHSLFWIANILDCEEFFHERMGGQKAIKENSHTINQNKLVRSTLEQCAYYCGANIRHSDIQKNIIAIFTEHWNNCAPADINPEKWNNKLQKVLHLIKQELIHLTVKTSFQLDRDINRAYGNQWRESKMTLKYYNFLSYEKRIQLQQEQYSKEIKQLAERLAVQANWPEQ